MATYKELFFKAIDQLVEKSGKEYSEDYIREKIRQEIKIEEQRISYSNQPKYESMKDKFEKFYENLDILSLTEIVVIVKNLIDCMIDDE